jgi:hypothetical protein
MSLSARTSRRLAIAAVAALASTAIALREFPVLLKRYRRTPYDDLLSGIDDRDAAEVFGRHAIKSIPNLDKSRTAWLLRDRMKDKSLKQLLESDLLTGRVVEVAGWVVPESLALICALASLSAL